MNLDCDKDDQGLWQVIDYDDSCKVLSVHSDIDMAWCMAANILAKRINRANRALKGEGL